MRLSKFALVLLPLLPAGPALATQDQSVIIGGIDSVCTGVGSAKDNPAWSAYPVKLVFANAAGQNLAQVHVAVLQGAKAVVETDCDAPWVLMKLPAGSYSVAATVGARSGKASFTTKGGAQQTVTVMLPAASQ
jgi:hypothetical protein